jgi:signal transduction histidine kinase
MTVPSTAGHLPEKLMLYEFLNSNRETLIARCRLKVVKRRVPRATQRELEHGIPTFLDQLTEVLREDSTDSNDGGTLTSAPRALHKTMEKTASGHGDELLTAGFTVDQVVHDYGDLCQAVTELAIEHNTPITNREFQALNRSLDNAIADAVSAFARGRDLVNSNEAERTMNERLGFLAHEFRNLINTAMLAADAIRRGQVGVGGSTGAILDRSLRGLQDLTARTLVDVRLRAGFPTLRQRILVSEFIEDAQVFAAFEAHSHGVELVIADIESGLAIDADRQILAGALVNLLQNAFKFTRYQGRVCVKAFSKDDRVLIEVEDECGGLPDGNSDQLFEAFAQRGTDRSGMGLGLNISRRGVEANQGKLYVRDHPGKGCVFIMDLPKAGTAAV